LEVKHVKSNLILYFSFMKIIGKIESGLVLMLAVLLLVTSCNNRAIMFRTKRDYPFEDPAKIPDIKEYRISQNDRIDIQITPNKGAMLIESNTVVNNALSGRRSYIVEFDGSIKIPLLGRIKIEGLTTREAELMIEERMRSYFVDPYVTIDILNKRIILFPGSSGIARIITLDNPNTTLLEAIAGSGGIGAEGKANRIKLIRGDLKNPKIYLIDLSTIEGINKAGIVLEGDDIIYIEPRNDFAANINQRIAPSLGLINLLITTYLILK
jgi:polysaccharide export outer membrane protein